MLLRNINKKYILYSIKKSSEKCIFSGNNLKIYLNIFIYNTKFKSDYFS